jgi:PAS domain S-box-containing protein
MRHSAFTVSIQSNQHQPLPNIDNIFIQTIERFGMQRLISPLKENLVNWSSGLCDQTVVSGIFCVKGKPIFNSDTQVEKLFKTVLDITERKQAEAALQRQLAAVEAAMDGIAILNSAQEYIYLNKAHIKLYGYDSSTQLLGKTWRELYYPDELRRLEQDIFPILSRQGHWHGEAIGKKRDESTYFQEVSLTLTTDGGLICVCRDITERKQAEIARQQQVERERLVGAILLRIRQSLELDEILNTTVAEVRQFLQTDRVLIYRFNSDWSGQVAVESVGADWTAILDITFHDPCFGKDYAQLYQQGRVRAIANIHTAGLTPCYVELLAPLQVIASLTVPIMQGEKLWGLLIAHHCRGEKQWQSYEIELLQQLATQVAIAVQQSELYSRVQAELIERQRIEQELRVSEALYRSVVTAMSEGIVLQQADGQITACNASAESILGLSAQEMMGKTSIDRCWQTIYEDGSPFPGELHPAMVTLGTGEPQSNVIMGVYKLDGSLTWISINSQPLFHPGETKPHAVVTSFSDISDRKRAEEALRALTQQERERALQLEQALIELQRSQTQLVQNEKMASLGQLVAGVAHEINNPTSFIYGNIYLASDYAKTCYTSSNFMASTIPEPVIEIAEQVECID